MGIEPTTSAWKAEVLPLNYTRSFGRSGRIRTCDTLLPRQVRYQTALHPEHKKYYSIESIKSQGLRRALYIFFLIIKRLSAFCYKKADKT